MDYEFLRVEDLWLGFCVACVCSCGIGVRPCSRLLCLLLGHSFCYRSMVRLCLFGHLPQLTWLWILVCG